MARKDPYEELLGYYVCRKCSRRPGKQVICCKKEVDFQDGQFLFYFEANERSKWAEQWIAMHEPNQRSIIFHRDKILEIIHTSDINWDVMREWLNEYFPIRSVLTNTI